MSLELWRAEREGQRLALEVTRPAGAPSAAINGYRDGGVQVVVPAGWTVAWDWRSADSTAPHSLVVMAEREKLPTEGGRPAFTNAMTRMLAAGLAAGIAFLFFGSWISGGWTSYPPLAQPLPVDAGPGAFFRFRFICLDGSKKKY